MIKINNLRAGIENTKILNGINLVSKINTLSKNTQKCSLKGWIDELELKRRSMLEQTDMQKSGDLMKEIIKGQQQFFNGKGQTNTPGETSRSAPKRSPAKTGV